MGGIGQHRAGLLQAGDLSINLFEDRIKVHLGIVTRRSSSTQERLFAEALLFPSSRARSALITDLSWYLSAHERNKGGVRRRYKLAIN